MEDQNQIQELLPSANVTKEKQVRITQHGKMKTWIAHSLEFLENEQEDQFVVLHSFPNTPREEKVTPKAASLVTAVVPRLISVAEILKREYIKQLETRKSARMFGLHQYNEVGTLEELGIVVGDEETNPGETDEAKRSLDIIQALSGKNHLRQTQTPFLRITLSKIERPDLLAKGASYQPPTIRKLSKAAKARAKKRAKAELIKDTPMEDVTAVAEPSIC